MIIVNRAGAVAMEASHRFKYEIASELGLRDVFKLKREYMNSKLRFEEKEFELFGKKITGIEYEEVKTDLECPGQEEIDEYIRKRDEYIAEQILKECGWNEFVKRCKLDDIEDFIDKHRPCEGPDEQCNMFCSEYRAGCKYYIEKWHYVEPYSENLKPFRFYF